MTQVSEIIQKQNNDCSIREQGRSHFDAIREYLLDNDIPNKNVSEKCTLITGACGKEIFLRFYFNAAAGWGNAPYYSVGLYSDRKTSTPIMADDGKTLLITSQRGINGSEYRFANYLSKLTKRTDLKPLKLG